MISLLYLTAYVQSQNIKKYFNSAEGLPLHSLNITENPKDENNNLPSQISYWFNVDSFNTKEVQ
jgi:hypothetical protein